MSKESQSNTAPLLISTFGFVFLILGFGAEGRWGILLTVLAICMFCVSLVLSLRKPRANQ